MSVALGWRALKFVVKHADELGPPAYLAAKYLLDQEKEVEVPGWHRVVVRFSRNTPTGTQEDYAQCKFDLLKITDDGSDNAWSPADFTAINTALDTWNTTTRVDIGANHTLKEYRYYRMRYNPDDPGPEGGPANPPKPFQDTGGPVYIGPKNVVGTSGNVAPFQVTMTLTFRTPFAKHWGRIYVPGFVPVLDAFSRLGTTQLTRQANAMFDLQDDLGAAGFLLVVPMTQMGKRKFHGLAGVTSIVADDIPDVQRRRRAKTALIRQVGVE